MIKTKAKGWGSGGWGGDPDSEWKEHGGGQGHGGGHEGGFRGGFGGVLIADPYVYGGEWNPYYQQSFERKFLENDESVEDKRKRLKKELENLNRKSADGIVSNSLGSIKM
jgi:hypothetical protein